MRWEALKAGLLNAESTTAAGNALLGLAMTIEDNPAAVAELLADGAADEPNLLALLRRNVIAAERYSAAMARLRSAVLSAYADKLSH